MAVYFGTLGLQAIHWSWKTCNRQGSKVQLVSSARNNKLHIVTTSNKLTLLEVNGKQAAVSYGTFMIVSCNIEDAQVRHNVDEISVTHITVFFVICMSPHTHTHNRLTALCPGLPRWAGTRNEKPIWILLEQEMVSGSGISWAICKSAPRSRQITTPATHHSSFFTGRMPFLPPNQQRQSSEGTSI